MIPAGVCRMVMYGTLPGGEIWNAGYFIDIPASSPTEASSFATTAFTVLSDGTGTHFGARLAAKWLHNGSTFAGVKCYSYNSAGTHATYKGQSSGGALVGTALGSLTNPTSVVLTVNTALAGSTHRGRIYMPAVGQIPDTINGYFPSTDVANLCAAFATDIKTASNFSTQAHLIVVSQKLTSFMPAVSISVDQRPDTQRRRANRQAKGTRSTTAIP